MNKKQKRQFFDEKFDSVDATQDFLPVFHSCDAFFFRTILTEKRLTPLNCTVFKDEKLLYLFYGRPAYKSSNNASSGLHSLLPVSFIIKTSAIGKIKRMAPFDTGAFNIGLYKEYLHPEMKLNDFFLTPNMQAISKTVSYFFATNEQYFANKPKEKIKYDVINFEIESYYNLIKGMGQGRADDRKASIEIQLASGIELTSNSVEAVIIPENFMSSTIVQDVIKDDFRAEIITYESYGIPSDNYYSQVLFLTKEYLSKKHNLNGSRSIL
ncbi:MAG TPA: hypothetical protein VGM63_01210 [Mucilaginibacter sp.]|jgi:hypothetical protein